MSLKECLYYDAKDQAATFEFNRRHICNERPKILHN